MYMSILIASSLLCLWLCVGWMLLGFAKVADTTLRGLLAPVVGMATVTLITTMASLAGMPIKQSMWIVVLAFVASLVFIQKAHRNGLKEAAGYHAFVLVLNLCVVGIGLFLFGMSWQGMLNNDASTNSLAAQYFISHSFFSEPSVQSILSGTDYSSLSSKLYVVGGHRFGDVMLLGFTASLFSLNPDEVYMAHALAIRCAFIVTAALLIYQRGAPAWKLLVPIVLLTLSPLATYTYLNQLISQMGGVAFILAAAILLEMLLSRREKLDRLLLPLAIVVAALCQSYPESISLLTLGVLIFGIVQAKNKTLPTTRMMLTWGGVLILGVLVLINASLPNALNHMLGVTGWGVAKVVALNPSDSDFNYAFTPDLFPILWGFKSFQEGIIEPWALVLQVFSILLSVALVVFAVRRVNRYPLLISLSLAALVAFLVLFLQGNRFGTFKIMLLAQPFIYILLAAAIIELSAARILIGVIALLGLVILAGRVGVIYVNQAMSPFTMLEKIQDMASSTSHGVIMSSPNFLIGKFAVLRNKQQAVYFDQNFPGFYGGADGNIWREGERFQDQKKREQNNLKWLPYQADYKNDLNKYYSSHYRKSIFQCAPRDIQAKFENLVHEALPNDIQYLVPGGQLIPLNRKRFGEMDFVLLDKAKIRDFLVFRPSSLGDYYGVSDTVGIFGQEQDPLTRSKFSSVGRYLLLEILAPSEDRIKLALSFSRTYLGEGNRKVPEITIYGDQPVKLATAGEGATSMTSPPLHPCVIDGRAYVLVDFGVNPIQHKPIAPLAYQLLDAPYVPDRRRLTGYLRDISVVSSAQIDSDIGLSRLAEQWDFEAFESAFEFSGIFEDGWLSNHVILRPRFSLPRRKIYLAIDVPAELAEQRSLLSIDVDGKLVKQQALLAGRVNVQIDLPTSKNQKISLTVDKPLVLPAGDGRSVLGLLRSVTAE